MFHKYLLNVYFIYYYITTKKAYIKYAFSFNQYILINTFYYYPSKASNISNFAVKVANLFFPPMCHLIV
jgi:hypothetical protein